MRADEANWTFFIEYLNRTKLMEIYFYKDLDRAVFIYELAKKMNFRISSVISLNDYYGMPEVYSLRLEK